MEITKASLRKKQILGGIIIMVAAFFWGISGTIIKFMFNQSVDPIKLVNMRLNLSTLIGFAALLIFSRKRLKVTPTQLKHFAIFGIFGITGVQTTYYYTVKALNVSMAIFLQFMAPMLATLYCVIFEKEKLTLVKGLSLGSALLGCAFIVFGAGAGLGTLSGIGLFTGIMSAVFCAFYYVYGKKCTNKYDSWTVLIFSLGFGALLYWFVCPPWVLWPTVTMKEFLLALYIAVFATLVPFGLYLLGLRYLLSSTASIIAMLEPVVASFSAFIVLGESMTAFQVLGAVAVMAAVIALQIGDKTEVETAASGS